MVHQAHSTWVLLRFDPLLLQLCLPVPQGKVSTNVTSEILSLTAAGEILYLYSWPHQSFIPGFMVCLLVYGLLPSLLPGDKFCKSKDFVSFIDLRLRLLCDKLPQTGAADSGQIILP